MAVMAKERQMLLQTYQDLRGLKCRWQLWAYHMERYTDSDTKMQNNDIKWLGVL